MKEISREEITEEEIGFMEEAQKLALMSNCNEAQYGAIIVKNNKIIGHGYNHTIDEKLNCDSCPRRILNVSSGVASDLCHALHAERAAIDDVPSFANYMINGSKIYIGKRKNGEIKETRGKPYCTNCAQSIFTSGIEKVIFYKNGGFLVFDSSEYLRLSYENLTSAYKKVFETIMKSTVENIVEK